jgi:ubiquinone/menaquinone biosynthesis C-methylase UbiE
MNENHRKLCPSPEWASFVQSDVLPALVQHAELGQEMLEVGPGPGAATDWLRHRVKRLVAVEVDAEAAEALATRFAGSNVEVVTGDGRDLPQQTDTFDSVGCFTMLHHVPDLARQRQLLSEVFRVLKPGGAFIGSDSLGSTALHEFHVADTYNPIDPAVLLVLLRSTGFERLTLVVDDIVKFVAHKPTGDEGATRCGRDSDGRENQETTFEKGSVAS